MRTERSKRRLDIARLAYHHSLLSYYQPWKSITIAIGEGDYRDNYRYHTIIAILIAIGTFCEISKPGYYIVYYSPTLPCL